MKNNASDRIRAARTEEIDELLKKLSTLLYDPSFTRNAENQEEVAKCTLSTIHDGLTVTDAIIGMLIVAKPEFKLETIDEDEKVRLDLTLEVDEDEEDKGPFLAIDSCAVFAYDYNNDEDDDDQDDDDEDMFEPLLNLDIVAPPTDPNFLEQLERLDESSLVSYRFDEEDQTPEVNLMLDPTGEHIVLNANLVPEDFIDDKEVAARCRIFAHPNGMDHFVMIPVALTRELHLALRLDSTEDVGEALQTIKNNMDDVASIDEFFRDVYLKIGAEIDEIPGDIMCPGDDTIIVSGDLTIGEDFENEDDEYVPIIKLKSHRIEGGTSVELNFSTGVMASGMHAHEDD